MVGRVLALMLAVMVLAASCSSDSEAATEDSQPALGTEEAGDGTEATSQDAADDPLGGLSGEPIKIGEVSSYSGLNIFPEAATLARVIFQDYNEAGGVQGRPIQLVSVDAQDTIEGAASGARRLLEEEEVIGFCCGGSIVDCDANAEYYQQNGVEAVGTTAACGKDAPTFHAINAGPFFPTLHMLDYFYHDLGHDKICFVGYQALVTEAFEEIFLPMWQGTVGLELVEILSPDSSEGLTPSVVALQNAGCEAVLAAFTDLNYQGFFRVAEQQGILDTMVIGMLTSGYSIPLLDASGDIMEGVYTNSEYEPYTGDIEKSAETQGFIDLTTRLGVLQTSFGQGGYIAAHIVIEVLESIEGEINFESFQEAVRNIEYESLGMGDVFRATGMSLDGTQPNQNSQVLRLEDGVFQPKTDWRTFPHQPTG